MIVRNYKLTGMSPLMMHNGQLADPLNAFAIELKKVSSVKNKTLTHHEKMARIEFEGGLYIDPETGNVAIPAEVLRQTIICGAKKQKRGMQAKAAVLPTRAYFPLIYSGPKSPDELYDNKAFVSREMVRVSTSRVARSRPIFNKWSVEVSIMTDESIFPVDQLDEAITISGEVVGIGEKRPTNGRFSVEVV